MITNERQYRITRTQAERFRTALTRLDEGSDGRHPLAQKALRESMESQLATLQLEMAAYEDLRDGTIRVLEADSLSGLADALIQARAALNLSQEELAARLGRKKQQIQHYETTRYASASLATLQAIVEAMGLTVHERVLLPERPPPVAEAGQKSHTP